MILDDDTDQHRALTRALGPDYDYALFASSSEIFQAAAPDLFLCDLQLADGRALEVLAKARANWPTTARLVISGQLTEADLIQFLNRDLAHRVLRKPWAVEELRQSVLEGLAMTRVLKDRQYWQELSLTDPVTHLWNRRGFLQQMVRESSRARRHRRPYSLLMIDLDRFKEMNDEKGHSYGDEVLRKLSRLFTESVRAIDWVCRYGGDEFAILLPEAGTEEAFEVAERLRLKASAELGLHLSLGLAAYPDHAEDPAQIVESADRALYTAKTSGRNQTAIAGSKATPLT
ncbi:MAG: diguanylate cyclase [Bdellovibrionaceae bacterium]|nr:diguanylate cyclase [Pseudobdellovibrionaceae bacterium]